jgi:hypothetical protein
VLNRWIVPKPHGMADSSAHACASPAMAEALGVVSTDLRFDGFYGTRVSNGTKQGRPMGRGGSAG